ncbi:MAG: hypothetical protein ACJAZO_002490 [Myxococcota bacterium]|jgi:hypothetical protein
MLPGRPMTPRPPKTTAVSMVLSRPTRTSAPPANRGVRSNDDLRSRLTGQRVRGRRCDAGSASQNKVGRAVHSESEPICGATQDIQDAEHRRVINADLVDHDCGVPKVNSVRE